MILITGGAGYIGSHCALSLLEKGYKIVVFDNLYTGHIETIQNLSKYGDVNFVKGDLRNKDDIQKVFSNYKISAVIHFAALALVGESVKDPQKYYLNNVCGTLNLLEEMLKNNVKKLVFSSTAATYGEPKYSPIDEKHEQNPINPYGQSKLMVEKILDDYSSAYDLKSVRLRYFNVVGADKKSRIGEWHEVETHLVPNILKSTFSNQKTFEIFGDNYETKDGTCVRDYVNVEDLVNAHILALEYLNNGGETNFFNLGTKEGNSVKEVFSACEKICGKNIPVKIAPKRPGDPSILVADNVKAKNVLGWKPSISLDDSIYSALKWEEKLQNKNF